MSEDAEVRIPKTIERAGQEDRYRAIVETGRRIFENSGIVDSSFPIKESDVENIHQFHKLISPKNWKESKEKSSGINDPSTFSNWEEPGGPLEHINLAMRAGPIILEEILKNIKPEDETGDSRLKEIVGRLREINPYLLAAAGGLHDEGRELTHVFYRTDLVGGSLLNKVGVVKEIIDILPDERLMLTPPDEDMNEKVLQMAPEAVIVRIADDFGKRMAGTNRTVQPNDISLAMQEAWSDRYRERSESGYPSDIWMRKRFPLHNANAQRYIPALDNWLRQITGKSLSHFTQVINEKLSPSLPTLPEAELK